VIEGPDRKQVSLSGNQAKIFGTLVSRPSHVFDKDTLYRSSHEGGDRVTETERKVVRTNVSQINQATKNTFDTELVFLISHLGYTLTPPEP
jgi:DNA-binding response OmpR family regulator